MILVADTKTYDTQAESSQGIDAHVRLRRPDAQARPTRLQQRFSHSHAPPRHAHARSANSAGGHSGARWRLRQGHGALGCPKRYREAIVEPSFLQTILKEGSKQECKQACAIVEHSFLEAIVERGKEQANQSKPKQSKAKQSKASVRVKTRKPAQAITRA